VFYNGKVAGRGSPTANEGGTPFVVGNAGRDNPEHFFVGRMRCVRISRGERYAGEFTPAETFQPDGTAVLIFDASKAEGPVALDLSGHRSHGVLEGVVVEADTP
jgi:hypothetical protein